MQICRISIFFIALLFIANTSFSKQNLVQDHINDLKNHLKAEPLPYKERRKLQGNLRGELNKRMYGTTKRVKRLDNPKTRALAESVIDSYNDIMKKKGNHQQAAHNYAERAMGVIGLHINARSGKQSSAMHTPGHPTAAEPMSEKKSSGWLQNIENMVGGTSSGQTTSSSSGKGALAAGAAGAAAGAASRSRATPKKAHAKKIKKAKPAEHKKNKTAGAKKHPKKSMAEKRKKKAAKIQRKAAHNA